MIFAPHPLDEPAARLLRTLASRGSAVVSSLDATPREVPITVALSTGPFVFDVGALAVPLAGRPARLLVLGRLGTHRDARHPALKRLWRIEELARASGLPTLALRLAPLVGVASPLTRRLASRPALGRRGERLVQPVAEPDAVATLQRAMADAGAWAGWYEVAGREVVTLAELRDRVPPATTPADDGAWEPPLEEIDEHRLAEPGPWLERYGLEPTPLDRAVAA